MSDEVVTKMYPKLKFDKAVKKHRNHKPLCNLCKEKAYRKLTVENNIFRGDDDVYLLCENHTALAKESLSFISNYKKAE